MSLLKFDFQHRERTKLVVLTLFACFGILYLAPKILSIYGGDSEDYFDFQLFWQAGKIWASGGNPYDATVIPMEKARLGQPSPPGFTRPTGIR